MIKIVYISGLIHSGTTFLERLITTLPETIGLGEVFQTLYGAGAEFESSRKRICTCGDPADQCTVWQTVFSHPSNLTIAEQLSGLIRAVSSLSPGITIVDSSKSIAHLQVYVDLIRRGEPIDLRVIYLYRDVRGWAHAIRRKGRTDRTKSSTRRRVGVLRNYYFWFFRVMKSLRDLHRLSLPFIPVAYESVVFMPVLELKRISAFAGLSFTETTVHDPVPNVHQLFGNAMRKDPQRNRQIVYDPAWIRDWKITLLMPLAMIPVIYSVWLQRKWSASISTRDKGLKKAGGS